MTSSGLDSVRSMQSNGAPVSIELQRLQDALKTRLAMQWQPRRTHRRKAKIGRALPHAVLDSVKRTLRLADGHPIDRGGLPAIGAFRHGEPRRHRRLPTFGAIKFDQLVGKALGA